MNSKCCVTFFILNSFPFLNSLVENCMQIADIDFCQDLKIYHTILDPTLHITFNRIFKIEMKLIV